MIAPPHGFTHCEAKGVVLLIDDSIAATSLREALLTPWRHVAPRPPGPGTGRGPRGLLRQDDAPVLLVKQACRGGWLAHVNRERFFRLERFHDELSASRAARLGGLPAGETLAITLRRAGIGWNAWIASRWIEPAEDLLRTWLTTSAGAQRAALWSAAVAFVDTIAAQGILHADLNLGNLLVRASSSGWSFWLIDFDRARSLTRPLTAAERLTMQQRLERSRRKAEQLWPGG